MGKKSSGKQENLPSVLAFEKKLVPSDGYMYGTTWEKRMENCTALKIKEKTLRCTISNRLKENEEDNPAKLDAKIENPNIQTIDYCNLEENQDTLKLQFTLKILGGLAKPSACNNMTFIEKYEKILKDYIDRCGFKEIAKRYAVNLANARFLWRNRVGVEKIEVKIRGLVNSKAIYTFDALSIPLNDFESDSINQNQDIEDLAKEIAAILISEDKFLILDIETYAKVGKAQDVYPSEEFILNKSRNEGKKSQNKGEKKKVLYSINEVAAMHSQKIGNAIRTIDTWYPDYGKQYKAAIAIEPYGAVTTLGKAFRRPKNKEDFYSILDKWVLDTNPPSEEKDQHYVMAVMVRGGVFSKAEDKGKDKKKSDSEG